MFMFLAPLLRKAALPNLIPVYARDPLMSTQRPAYPLFSSRGEIHGVV